MNRAPRIQSAVRSTLSEGQRMTEKGEHANTGRSRVHVLSSEEVIRSTSRSTNSSPIRSNLRQPIVYAPMVNKMRKWI